MFRFQDQKSFLKPDTRHWSTHLSRVINLDSAGKDRTRLTKGIVLAIRELAKQSEPTAYTRDLAAFIALALQTIAAWSRPPRRAPTPRS